MLPNELAELHLPSDPSFSPDGSSHVYVVTTPNLEEDRYDSQIWVDGEPFDDSQRDSNPRWTPDGSGLAFLRMDENDKKQVFVKRVTDDEPKQVTDFELGVSAVEWSPASDQLVVVATTYTREWEGLDDDERKRRPRRISTVPFRFDQLGWIDDRRRHVWLIDPDGDADPRCLTEGGNDEVEPAWSPDASKIAYLTHTAEHNGLESGNELWEVELESGSQRQIGDIGWHSKASYSPSGALHYLGNCNPIYPVDSQLHRIEADGSVTNLTGHLDRGSVSLAAGPAQIIWDGVDAVVALEDSGKVGLIRVSPDGEVTPLIEGDCVVTGFDVHEGRVISTTSKSYRPTEVYVDDDPISTFNTEFDVIDGEHFTIDSEGTELDVWVFLPVGDDSVPLLLNIHGGPASQYGFGFFDEFQVYAAAGYGVVATNPRGSSGKGLDHLDAVRGEGWGVVDLADIRAVVEAALARYERLDAQRMGVMGGSYGGFMTGWIIGQEDRWRSAVVERALTSWTSFAGTSDIGGVFPHNYLDNEYPNAWDTWWEKGPLSLVHNVSTPTLVIHSEEDWRCPIEQAEQYFMGLLRNGTTAEMLRFPGEGHEMSRSGKPKHRQERFEAILDWHNRHLK